MHGCKREETSKRLKESMHRKTEEKGWLGDDYRRDLILGVLLLELLVSSFGTVGLNCLCYIRL